MSDGNLSRRNVLVTIGTALAPAGAAAQVHQHNEGSPTVPASAEARSKKTLNEHESKTLARLADLIIPPEGGSPGASEAGAPAYIEFLIGNNDELAAIYTGGIAWLDRAMEKRTGKDFLGSTPAEQAALLDLIAYRKNAEGELGPGVLFFEWARKMVVDGYYTSPAGVKDVGYLGNKGVSKFVVPAASLDYAIKKSGL